MKDADFVYSIVENFIGGICASEVDSRTLKITPIYLNDGIYRMLGGNKVSVDQMFADIRLSIIPDDTAVFEQGLKDILADDGTSHLPSVLLIRKDGLYGCA